MMLKTVVRSAREILLPLAETRQRFWSLFSLTVVFALTVNWISAVKCDADEHEFYSSVAGLESLLETERILITDLKDYISATKQQIVVLEKCVKELIYKK